MNSPTNGISIEDRLREVYEKTDSREYAEALDVLEIACSSDPGNIYVAALRRQLEALLSLSQADDLSEDQRHERSRGGVHRLCRHPPGQQTSLPIIAPMAPMSRRSLKL